MTDFEIKRKMKRRSFLGMFGLGGLTFSVPDDPKKLKLVKWSSGHACIFRANTFVDGKRPHWVIMASETMGWVRYIARKNKSPFDPHEDNDELAFSASGHLVRKILKGNVEIRFFCEFARESLLKEQEEESP